MPRRRRTAADIQARYAGLERDAVIAAVCKYFCEGAPVSQIRDLVNRQFGMHLNREEPWQFLAYAAQQGRLRYLAPLEQALSDRVREAYPGLKQVAVLRTAVIEDVAFRAAQMLLELVQEHCRRARVRHPQVPPVKARLSRSGSPEQVPRAQQQAATTGQPGENALHIGFGGGRALRLVAKAFSELLSQKPAEELPSQIVFHAMVGGFNLEDPTTDPNAFFTFFVNNPAIPVKITFVGLPAPMIVETEQMDDLFRLEEVKKAYGRRGELDIIATSAGNFEDEHSRLRKHLRGSGQSLRALENAGCIGDLLWRPLGLGGAIQARTQTRLMTLIRELAEVGDLVQNGVDVLLVAGPCPECNRSKSKIVQAILDLEPRLVTHLVLDIGSVPRSKATGSSG